MAAVGPDVQPLCRCFAISWAFHRSTCESAMSSHQFSAEVMVVSAGSVEGHLIIVRSNLRIEAVFNFCVVLPESRSPVRVSDCWSHPLEMLSYAPLRFPDLSDRGVNDRYAFADLRSRTC